MYISIPTVFHVPVCYVEDILNIKEIVHLHEYNAPNDFINKTTNRLEVKIGISLPLGDGAERWPKDRGFLENYARIKNATLIFATYAKDAVHQDSLVESLISQSIDVLIIAPIDLNASAFTVEKARRAGVKVIAYDRLINNTDLDLYVSFNNIGVGELQGRYLTHRVPRGNYIILSGSPTDNNSKLYKYGAMTYIKPLAAVNNIRIVTETAVDNWDPKVAYEIVKNSLIANNNKIDAILAPNDALAGAVIQALEEQNLEGKVFVTGLDAELSAIRRIIRGTQSMTVFADSREESKIAIEAAIKLVIGEPLTINSTEYNGKIDVPSILIAPIYIDKSNITDILINSGYYNLNEIYCPC